jgi:RNA polymerase sigma-70 factor (ECF subfamily)
METTSVAAAGAEMDALVLAASAGDRQALNDLLTRLRPEALRLSARFLPNREDAEEACQDTLMAVARGIGQFHGQSAFRTWFYRIAANRARSTYQGLRRRYAGEAAGVPLPDQADPRRTSVVAGTRLDLLDALESLVPEYAEAVVLRDVLDLSYGEIAALLGVPDGTVKSRIHVARRQLRHRLDANKGGRGGD